ncbi:hypothetical protein [Burkholderia territorii]|uniref:Uncharacterized protein n=1 Tax=Burkholderia territorii TaxID=1503055 RepID=A0A6L3N7H8_9BURK|nr:hypothetical protein [Burkholderia territorii]KAB0648475.1 hypothetical protein F7R13_30465 [Burkholderia territorii]MBM2777339.1 hypothetical protein [Burkholderia territorii]VWB82197.1 hypothetical protein BTE28158_03902 [Burkholderia territorii]
MLRNAIGSGPLLSRGLRDAIAALATLMYVGVYANARAVLPEFIFRDADKIQTQIGGGSTYEGSSFDAVGKLYQMLGNAGTALFVVALGIATIWIAVRQARRAGALAACLALIAPCLFFNLFVASKDTVVVAMSIVVLAVARRRGTGWAMPIAAALYLGYAATIRSYFALILAIALAAWAFRRASALPRLAGALLAVAVLVSLPDAAYMLLQQPRDLAVDYLVYSSPFGARTSFYNPFMPDSFAHFVGNYAYSLVRLNLPVLFSLDPKGVAMQALIALFLGAAWRRIPALPARDGHASPARDGELLASLILGHVAVSMLFEPDLGSYLRHLSSVAPLAVALWSIRTQQAPA